MGVLLRDLYEAAQGFSLELVAGGGGLDRPVSWVHMVEGTDIAAFLEGDELAFITGIALSGEGELEELIAALASCGASGAVLNLGPYVPSVPATVVERCDELGFPLFTVPWEVHMAQIMRVFAAILTKADHDEAELAAALASAILSPAQEELYVPTLEHHGFMRSARLAVMALDARSAQDGTPLASDAMLRKLERSVEADPVCAALQLGLFVFEHRLVAVIALAQGQGAEAPARALFAACSELTGPDARLFCGVGAVAAGPAGISASYAQARDLGRLQRLRGQDAGPAHFDRAGIDQLLLSTRDRAVLEGFYRDTVAPLVEHDELFDGDLVRVLASYLEHSGSVKETADELFVHRNTVNYKLHRIEALLGRDLSSFHDRELLHMGLVAHEVLQIR